MTIFFVTGFLGSGKTTAIVGAAKALVARKLRVGVVTNDQGRYLVDHNFVDAQGISTVSVAGGCFCCNYDEFERHVLTLHTDARPDVVFAESVGSCTDVLATVVKPLLDIQKEYGGSVSTFVDARLLERRVHGKPLPFSDSIVYIFDKQIEEAQVLVVNKRDLLPSDLVDDLVCETKKAYGVDRVIAHSAHEEGDGELWLQAAEEALAVQPGPSMEMDYERYGRGEAELAWLDAQLEIEGPDALQRINAALSAFHRAVLARRYPIGHIKLFAKTDHGACKVGVVNNEDPLEAISGRQANKVALTLNARVQTEPSALEELYNSEFVPAIGDVLVASEVQAFQPGFPRPTHRVL